MTTFRQLELILTIIWQKYLQTTKSTTDSQLQFQKILKDNGEGTKIEIDEVTKINTPDDFVNAESNIDNTKVIPVDQKFYRKLFGV